MGQVGGIRAGKVYVELGVYDKLTAGLRRARRQLQTFGTQVQALGRRMMALSAAGAVPFVLATRVFAGYEQHMARVRALTGATGKDFDKLAENAKHLGRTTIYTAGQVAEAMSAFALAGYSVKQILDATEPTLNLAAAGQLAIGEAADIAVKIMAGMGIEAKDLGGALDILTKAMTTANTDLAMLGEAMKFVGPIARSSGYGLEEITAAIQLLSNAGIQGQMAGTSLRMALIKLASPSTEAADLLSKLGVVAKDSAGNMLPLADIIQQLDRAMRGMGTGQKLGVLGTLFGARPLGGMSVLLEEGADTLRAYTEALRGAGGTAARVAATQLDTLRGTATILKSAVEDLGIAVGESLVIPLRLAIKAITDVAGKFAAWGRKSRDLIVMSAAAVVAIGAVGAALVSLGLTFKVAAFAIGVLLAPLVIAKVVFAALFSAIGLLLTPMGFLVASVITLGVAIARYTGAGGKALRWLGACFQELRKTVTLVLGGIMDAFRAGNVALATEIFWAAMKVGWLKGKHAVLSVWHGFVDLLKESLWEIVDYSVLMWREFTAVSTSAWVEAVRVWKTILTGFASWHGRQQINVREIAAKVAYRIMYPKASKEELAQADKDIEALNNKARRLLREWEWGKMEPGGQIVPGERQRIADEAYAAQTKTETSRKAELDLANQISAAGKRLREEARAARQSGDADAIAKAEERLVKLREIARLIARDKKLASELDDLLTPKRGGAPGMPGMPDLEAQAGDAAGLGARFLSRGTFTARPSQVFAGERTVADLLKRILAELTETRRTRPPAPRAA